MTIEKIEFQGFKNCYKIKWNHFKMIITQDVGPRILSLSFEENASIFGMKSHNLSMIKSNNSSIGGESNHSNSNDQWNLFGGHRLWHAPECAGRTYYPDNLPIQIEFVNDETMIIMRQAIEHTTGIKKTITMEIKGGVGRLSYIEVNHYLENKGNWPIQCAPWAISVLTKDTKAIIPLSNDSINGLVPKTSISLWNYTKLQDSRLTLGNKYIMVQQEDKSSDGNSSNKIGSRVNSGWSASITNSTLFVKIIDPDTKDLHVDLGANVEVYTDNDILELETVGKLLTLEPTPPLSPPIDVSSPLKIRNTTPFVQVLTEKWYLFQLNDIPTPQNDNDVDKNILPIINEILN
ncbi:hypothetical protein RB653_004810 [Dictyostelium firmibasis]|uniref:Uncharacterized protein n=1 Tax=Dictyostelium firmibasis TaxID=79012 RepID=A0AAN7YSK3_9MYCE